MYGFQGDICFEFRKSRRPGAVHRFLYERIRGILIVQGTDPVETGSESDRGKLEEPFTDVALRIIAAYEQGPAERISFDGSSSMNRSHQGAPGARNHRRPRIQNRRPLVRTHGQGLDMAQEISFTLAGSFTFFLFWTAYVVGSTEGLDSIEFNLVVAIFLGLSIVGSPWFAGITAWKDSRYGPVRLFLSGFLLPYFVWTLVAVMYARPIPEFVGSREPTPDVRPAPRPVVPAPPSLVPGIAPPQSSEQSS